MINKVKDININNLTYQFSDIIINRKKFDQNKLK